MVLSPFFGGLVYIIWENHYDLMLLSNEPRFNKYLHLRCEILLDLFNNVKLQIKIFKER